MPSYEELDHDNGNDSMHEQQQHDQTIMNPHPPQHYENPTSNNGLTDPPPNITRIQKRRYSFPKNNNSSSSNNSILSLDLHPDDESSTFLRGRDQLRWCHSRLYSYMRKLLIVCVHRLKLKKMDVSKLALMGLAVLAFVFMEFGMAGTNFGDGGNGGASSDNGMGRSTSLQESMMYNAGATGGQVKDHGSDSAAAGGGASIKGYQARKQVPIPIDYANFVELAEFADAVTMVRAHRHKMMQQQHKQQPHRRLDESDNNNNDAKKKENSNDEEVNEMNNAIDQSWEQVAKKANPEQSNLLLNKRLKVNHVPFFWHIPRTGGTTISTLLATCHSLVQATSSFSSPTVYTRGNDGALASRFRDPTLYVVQTGGKQFVNVDLDSLEGMTRAVNGKLIEKELADVVAVPDVRLGSLLFGDAANHIHEEGGGDEKEDEKQKEKEYKGVLFAMFRHPIDRAESWFYHKQSVKDSVHYDPSLEIYSLADWINSPSYITDYMVRTLVGKIDSWSATDNSPYRPPVPLTHDDLDAAKEILRRKCIIGLLEEKGESIKRFEKFFGWNADVHSTSLFLLEDEETAHAVQAARWKDVKDEECGDRLLHWNWMNKNKHPMLDEDGGSSSVAYNLLESKNRYDIEVSVYAFFIIQCL
mmetsp:Transcript_23238/g.41663  ORF Transcript_23238/g.41663 Transcript_23238/m.41663 type:complete len:642 (-) Transcript_23238:21-1946(-)